MTKIISGWGLCTSCRRTRPLSGNGEMLKEHRRWVVSLTGEWSAEAGRMERCDGSGKRPVLVTPAEPAGRRVQTVRPQGGAM